MTIPYPRRSLHSRVFWFTLSQFGNGVARFWPNSTQYLPVVEQVAVPVSGLPAALSGLRIAQMSDFHAGRHVHPESIRRAAQMAMALNPEMIALTGDFIHRQVSYARGCADALSILRAPLGVHAVLGNHDYWRDAACVVTELRRAGLPPLRNEARLLSRGGAPLYVVGVDDVRFRRADVARALRGVPSDATKILLVHEPDFADYVSVRGIAIQLSGHSHGGQICLPNSRPLLMPSGGRKYAVGLNRATGGHWVYTNRGIGVAMPPIRLNCPPEITLLTLETA
jgi:hypothetical protein